MTRDSSRRLPDTAAVCALACAVLVSALAVPRLFEQQKDSRAKGSVFHQPLHHRIHAFPNLSRAVVISLDPDTGRHVADGVSNFLGIAETSVFAAINGTEALGYVELPLYTRTLMQRSLSPSCMAFRVSVFFLF